MNITVSLPQRPGLGLQEAAQRNGLTVEELCGEILEHAGKSYANLYRIGVFTSAGFIKEKINPEEYISILTAANTNAEVAKLVQALISEETVFLDDERLPPALELLAAAGLLSGPQRVGEILTY